MKSEEFIYKIRHKETGMFLGIDYFLAGIEVLERIINEGQYNIWKGEHPGMGKILKKSHPGWKTPPRCTTEDYSRIGCEVVKYRLELVEVNETRP